MPASESDSGPRAADTFGPGTSPNVTRAWKILRENERSTLDQLKDLGEVLKGEKEFGWARQIFRQAMEVGRSQTPPADAATQGKLRQQRALCTYKDPALTAEFRLRVA